MSTDLAFLVYILLAQANDYADYDTYNSPYGEFDSRPGSGRALRTGRDARTYEEAKRDVKGPNSMSRTKVNQMRSEMFQMLLKSCDCLNMWLKCMTELYFMFSFMTETNHISLQINFDSFTG